MARPDDRRPHRRRRAATALVGLGLAVGLALGTATAAAAYNPVKICGGNLKCRVVDVLDRGLFNETLFSHTRVTEAWNQLLDEGCSDVADVVVGGTFGENGAPEKSVPAGFAEHVKNRCAIVVHYELEGPVIDAQAYEDSVEHGRKALAIVLNRVDTLRTAAGKTSRLRVWGHSKGAAIVESTWRMEARNNNTKFITTLNGVDRYVDACPSNNCYYFGFGYPWEMERANRFSISTVTAGMWSSTTDGYISKPATSNSHWWRLTTFTNLSDPIYECTLGCAWDLVVNARCHRYEGLLASEGYAYFDAWNAYTASSARPDSRWEGDRCGAVGDVGTFLVTLPDTAIPIAERTIVALEWTVPAGSWHVLSDLHVRIRDGSDIALWARFDEARGTLSLFQEPQEGFGPERALGSAAVLASSFASVHLPGSRVRAEGPTAPTMLLELEVSFHGRAAARTFVVEVAATDDLGNIQEFAPAGTLSVTERR